VIRISTLIALARRDLTHELRGRRAWVFVLITFLLMAPVASAPRFDLEAARARRASPNRIIAVRGDVPADMLENPAIRAVDGRAHAVLEQPADGPLIVHSRWTPRTLREHLDSGDPVVALKQVYWNVPLPNRSALLALLSAAILTGAVSESIGGERTRRTLETLLTAAITRHELVGGKWLAWTAYGAGTATLAATAAILGGRLDAGIWLLPLPTVAGFTVALGMYLIRSVRDVISGATVSLRWMPTVLALSVAVSWWIGLRSPALGALVPLGGAILTSGGTWEGWAPPILATFSTLSSTAFLLHLTARDLAQETRGEQAPTPGWRGAVITGAVAALACWPALLGAMLWAPAGNYAITESLDPAPGVLASGIGLLLLAGIRALNTTDAGAELGLWRPEKSTAFAWAAATGIALALSASVAGLTPLPEIEWLAKCRFRLDAAVEPAWAGLGTAIVAIVGQELLFRGWLQKHAGPILATVVWVAVLHPLDPLHGALVGGSLAALTMLAGGSVLPALFARVVWSAIGGLALSPLAAALVGVGAVGCLIGFGRSNSPRAASATASG